MVVKDQTAEADSRIWEIPGVDSNSRLSGNTTFNERMHWKRPNITSRCFCDKILSWNIMIRNHHQTSSKLRDILQSHQPALPTSAKVMKDKDRWKNPLDDRTQEVWGSPGIQDALSHEQQWHSWWCRSKAHSLTSSGLWVLTSRFSLRPWPSRWTFSLFRKHILKY